MLAVIFKKNKEMKYLTSLALILSLISCKMTEFPDKIQSTLTKQHFRLKGTKLFVRNIEGFSYIPDINTFKMSDSVYIQCLYTHGDFQHEYDNQKFDFFHNYNYKIISNKTFTINGLNGVYYKLIEGKSYWLYFIFGDSDIENRIVATFPINKNYDSKIYEFVRSIYYQPNYKLDELENAKFHIDLLNSSFEFSCFSTNSYVYMQQPKNLNTRANNICISQIPPIKTSILLKNTLYRFIENQKRAINITEIHIDSTLTDTMKLCATASGTFENREYYNKVFITSNSQTGLLFWTSLYNNVNKNIALTDSILNTITIK